MGQVLFIVWRESVEALLVIGVLHAWLRTNPDRGNGMWYLWGGVFAGVLAALGLGGAILWFQSFFAGDAQDYFQMAMVFIAAALIVQMVFWMKRNGRHLRRNLENGMQRATETARWFGMFTLVTLAVAREGSEMVIFLYGLGLVQQGMGILRFVLMAFAGFLMAGLTFWVLQWGGRRLSWKVFFRFSEVALLMLAASLLVTGLEKMEGFGWVPSLKAQLWNSTWLLDDSGRLGGVVSALTGYRAQPSLIVLLVYGLYWLVVLAFLSRYGAPKQVAATDV
jgi:high-affinity iron transporter